MPDATPPRDLTTLPAILDVEASGFGRNGYPIEVGYVLPNGTAYCALIRPQDDWTHWDEGAAQLHCITRAQLQARGQSVLQVAQQLNIGLRGLTVYSDGWAHDYTWLARLYEAAGMSPSFRLESLRALLSEEQAAQWHSTRAQVEAELGLVRHRASSDALLLQRTLQAFGRVPAPPA